MNILAIDFGEKNIGLAYYNFGNKVPLKLEVLKVGSSDKAEQELGKIIKDRAVTRLVFGLPLNFEFKETRQSKIVREFAERIEKKFEIEVDFVNEALSSLLANRLQESSKDSHSSSALLLLEDYLDKLDELDK